MEDKLLNTTGWGFFNQSNSSPPSQETDTAGISKRVDGSHLISQNDALASLRVVSQPHNVTIIDLTDNYKYNSAAGSGITVYVVDTGANPLHPEYQLMTGSKRWMFPGDPAQPGAAIRTQTDQVNHGGCVLSKLAGPRFGVAKDVDVVIVKFPSLDMPAGIRNSVMMDVWAAVAEDIQSNNLQGKAVVLSAGGGK